MVAQSHRWTPFVLASLALHGFALTTPLGPRIAGRGEPKEDRVVVELVALALAREEPGPARGVVAPPAESPRPVVRRPALAPARRRVPAVEPPPPPAEAVPEAEAWPDAPAEARPRPGAGLVGEAAPPMPRPGPVPEAFERAAAPGGPEPVTGAIPGADGPGASPPPEPRQASAPTPDPPAAEGRSPDPPFVPLYRLSRTPSFTRRVEPRYPEAERALGRQAEVVAEVRVGPDGSVLGVSILRSGGPAFDQAVRDALADCRFQAGRLGDVAVAVKLRVPFRFRLD